MSDKSNVLPLFLHTVTPWSAAADLRTQSNGAIASITWVANYACFVPVSIPWDYPVNRVFWVNGSVVGGNANFGIFDRAGKRIYAVGSTVTSGASIPQFTTPGTPFVLPAGEYFFAYAASGTTNVVAGSTSYTVEQLKMAGVLCQASDLALTDPATFATSSSALFPYCGVTRTGTGF
jgi:hypothetical protein